MSEFLDRTYKFEEGQDPEIPDKDKIILVEDRYIETKVTKVVITDKEQELQQENDVLTQQQQRVQDLQTFITDIKTALNIVD